jgi:hypothetical protein
LHLLDVGKVREVLWVVGVKLVRGRPAGEDDRSLRRPVLQRDVRVREQPHDVDEGLARHDDDALVSHLHVEGGAERKLHVGSGELEAPAGGSQSHPGEDLNGHARRHSSGDHAEMA